MTVKLSPEKKRENKLDEIRLKAKGTSLKDNPACYILRSHFCGWTDYSELTVDEVSTGSTTILGRFTCSEEGCSKEIRSRAIKKIVKHNLECKCPEHKKASSARKRTQTEAKKGNTIGRIAEKESDRGKRANQLIEQFVRFTDKQGEELDIRDCNWTSNYEAEWICLENQKHKKINLKGEAEETFCQKTFNRSVRKMTGKNSSRMCPSCEARERAIRRVRREGAKAPLKKSAVYKEITQGEKGARFLYCIDYPELLVDEVAVNSGLNVMWLCNTCGNSFSATISNRTRKKSGCPYCAGKKALWGKNDLYTYAAKNRRDLLDQWNDEQNGKMENYTRASGKTVIWKCERCGSEVKRTIAHAVRSGTILCKECSRYCSDSIPQRLIRRELETYFPDGEVQYNYREAAWLQGKELDILLKLNGHFYAIEYDGRYHNWEKDREKDALCEKRNITMIRIREPEAETYPNCKETTENFKLICRKTSENDDDLGFCIMELINFIRKKEHRSEILEKIDIKKDILKVCKTYHGIVPKEKSLKERKPTAARWLNTEPQKINASDIYANSNFIYPFHHYDKKRRVWHEWIAAPNNIREPYRCPVCTHRFLQKGVNDFETLYPKLMKEWNWGKNKELGIEPSNLLGAPAVPVFWTCPKCGKEYSATPNSRAGGSGCPCNKYAGRQKVKAINLDTGEEIHAESLVEMAKKLCCAQNRISEAILSGKTVGASGNAVPVICIDTGKKYRSIVQACKAENLTKESLIKALKSGEKLNGKEWKYGEKKKGWMVIKE